MSDRRSRCIKIVPNTVLKIGGHSGDVPSNHVHYIDSTCAKYRPPAEADALQSTSLYYAYTHIDGSLYHFIVPFVILLNDGVSFHSNSHHLCRRSTQPL